MTDQFPEPIKPERMMLSVVEVGHELGCGRDTPALLPARATAGRIGTL